LGREVNGLLVGVRTLDHHLEHQLAAVQDSIQVLLAKLEAREAGSEGRIGQLEDIISFEVKGGLHERLGILEMKMRGKSQPLYIKGPEDSSAAAKGCYEGAMLYLATFLLSVGYWMFDSLKAKSPPLSPLMNRAPPSNSYGGKYGAVVNDSF
ncbi:hypothetical protein B484DRAFT_437083, partial [Ochromonadaceae sp. CCMP2298]